MPNKREKVVDENRELLLKMLRENGGPVNLDLSDRDFSKADFSNLNLESVNFQNSTLRGVDFSGSWLEKSNFAGANLYEADFEGSSLWKANFDEVDAKEANFSNSNLMDASFRDALLIDANLDGAYLFRTVLSSTWLSRKDLGSTFIFEQNKLIKFAIHLDEQFSKIEVRRSMTIEQWFRKIAPHPLLMAQETYLSLKNNFSQIGRYDDASWAYVQERKCEKKTHWPPSVSRMCYQDEIRMIPPKGIRRVFGKMRFHLRHFAKYMVDWIVELAVGYGEKPQRSAGVALFTILIFAFLYKTIGGIVIVDSGGSSQLQWFDYLNYSLGAFSTIGFSKFAAITPFSQFLTSVEALSGISILALLMFALGNRVNRS